MCIRHVRVCTKILEFTYSKPPHGTNFHYQTERVRVPKLTHNVAKGYCYK